MSFDLLLVPPAFDAIGLLSLEALTPLSLVDQMPGKFYRSQQTPSTVKILGLLENALGWHLSEADRKSAIKDLIKRHNITGAATASGSGFVSLLQFHVRITETALHQGGGGWTWNDLWSQHLRTDGLEFVGGSRNYDKSLSTLMNMKARKLADIDEKPSSKRDGIDFESIVEGEKIHLTAVRNRFPRYYVTPTQREFIEPFQNYLFQVETSAALAKAIEDSLASPEACLYLGSNDGWVETEWKTQNGEAK